MKKFFALVLVLILALPSVGAFAATPAELLGTWYVCDVSSYGDNYQRIFH